MYIYIYAHGINFIHPGSYSATRRRRGRGTDEFFSFFLAVVAVSPLLQGGGFGGPFHQGKGQLLVTCTKATRPHGDPSELFAKWPMRSMTRSSTWA